ncbi:hypothetical protein CORMATOL_00138 [Corynebacterium matruchotii ATCC 33806]|uniref:Uncharacterized protein n=1 Tax=Corynebacterium matruchotii ATCC 33806 TaxID=566549 RepID=C0DZJ8_9CORY|nr:hypothetical protein CORMATOL_00138 [Corynebacterium matruchotii ATCC 33806]
MGVVVFLGRLQKYGPGFVTACFLTGRECWFKFPDGRCCFSSSSNTKLDNKF